MHSLLPNKEVSKKVEIIEKALANRIVAATVETAPIDIQECQCTRIKSQPLSKKLNQNPYNRTYSTANILASTACLFKVQ